MSIQPKNTKITSPLVVLRQKYKFCQENKGNLNQFHFWDLTYSRIKRNKGQNKFKLYSSVFFSFPAAQMGEIPFMRLSREYSSWHLTNI